MTLVLDAGALLALEKNDKEMWRRWKSARLAGFPPVTHGGIVGQVWRGRQIAESFSAQDGGAVPAASSETGARQ